MRPKRDSTPKGGRSRGRNRPPKPTDDRAKRARLRALRTRAETSTTEGIVLATVRVLIPSDQWVGAFSRNHPDVRIEYLTFSELEPHVSVSDCWIGGRPAGVWAPEISRFSDVVRIESLAELGRGCLYRITYRNPPIVYFYRRLGIPIHYPFWIQNGVVRWEIVTRYPEFRKILEFGRRVDPQLRVVSMHRGPLRSHLPSLSEAQQRILSTAMAAGYFEVPRKVSLTELAQRLRRSRSALSEIIASIEEKLLESSVNLPAFRTAGLDDSRPPA